METPDTHASPSGRTPLKQIVRRLFLVIGGLAALFGLALIITWFFFGTQIVPPHPLQGTIVLSAFIFASLFVAYLPVLILRAVTKRSPWVQRGLLTLAAAATVIAVFYAEENWRGKRDWANTKREFAARGETLDWGAFIPPPVPDDQNFFKAPKMTEWFVGRGAKDLTKRMAAPMKLSPNHPADGKPLIVAEITVASPAGGPNAEVAGVVLRASDATVHEQARKVIYDTVGQILNNQQGLTFVGRNLDRIQPAQITVISDKPLSKNEIAELFSEVELGVAPKQGSMFEISPMGDGGFELGIQALPHSMIIYPSTTNESPYSAEEYLAWSDTFKPDFELIREALKRPYARIECDYQNPHQLGIPNFVGVRSLCQMLAARAQCHLLLGQSDEAWRELSQVREACRMLEARPTGKPMTLVAAMINVAVSGVYVGVVADGFRMHAWQEPQLEAMQSQMKDVEFLPSVANSLTVERALVCRVFEDMTPDEWEKSISSIGGVTGSTWKKMQDPIYRFLVFAPRGWVCQNLVQLAGARNDVIHGLGSKPQMIQPRTIDKAMTDLVKSMSRLSPFAVFERVAIPNYSRAFQTAARNQTLFNEARIACALERYHLAQGQYPESLDALVPRYIEKIPADIIGGRPLKYHRDGMQFVLYSVGWNETDDGGVLGGGVTEANSLAHGDWVWPDSAKF